MFVTAVVLAFVSTLMIGAGIILLKWMITQIGVTFFVMMMVVLSLVFLLAMGESNYEE